MVNLDVFSSSGYKFCIILSYNGLEVGATLDIIGDTETLKTATGLWSSHPASNIGGCEVFCCHPWVICGQRIWLWDNKTSGRLICLIFKFPTSKCDVKVVFRTILLSRQSNLIIDGHPIHNKDPKMMVIINPIKSPLDA